MLARRQCLEWSSGTGPCPPARVAAGTDEPPVIRPSRTRTSNLTLTCIEFIFYLGNPLTQVTLLCLGVPQGKGKHPLPGVPQGKGKHPLPGVPQGKGKHPLPGVPQRKGKHPLSRYLKGKVSILYLGT